MSIISDNLRKARKAIDGLSQQKAAKLLGVKTSNIGAWEEGRATPPLSRFPKIIQLYGITDWISFIADEHFDPRKQSAHKIPPSLIEERYQKLPKKLQRVVDELLNLA